jgi:cell division septum initiation protein DivIVA
MVTVIAYGTERLTPELADSMRFAPAKLGRRGVDDGQVRDFCGWVARELTQMMNERTELEAQVQRLRGEGNGTHTAEDGQVQAVYILSKAQQTADRYVASAQEYSREVAEDARRHRDDILTEARTRASVILEDAHAKASTAASLVSGDQEPLDAGQRRDLEAELAYLRTFSEVYRTHLRAYLDSLARGIDEWERAEATAVTSARRGRRHSRSDSPASPAPE